MNDERIEQLLRRLPLRSLDPPRELELLARLHAAQARSPHGWSRPVPLWQAAAVTLLTSAAATTAALLLAPRADRPAGAPHETGAAGAAIAPVRIHLNAEFTGLRPPTRRSVDISQWQIDRVDTNGEGA